MDSPLVARDNFAAGNGELLGDPLPLKMDFATDRVGIQAQHMDRVTRHPTYNLARFRCCEHNEGLSIPGDFVERPADHVESLNLI
jgi:hypothetical protein